jgi:thymidylate synthase ThyX
MQDADVVVPSSVAADPKAREIYEDAVRTAWDAYHDLRERLVAANAKTMGAIGRIKGQSEKQIAAEAEKKSQEMARYVIPVAAATRLYHTISGIVLLRYIRMANASDAHEEARAVVAAMVAEVRAVDPDFVDKTPEVAHGRTTLPEWTLRAGAEARGGIGALGGHGGLPAAERSELGGHASVLVRATPDAPALVAQVLREVTGSTLPDDGLLAAVLDPHRDRLWNDTLNTWDHSPVLRSLRHVHYTFRKRLSLTAFAQDQRHRMTPATRPLLHRLVTPTPDVHVPDVIARDADALRVYERAISALWDAMRALQDLGVSREDCAYLLPNATNQYYTQSGDLLSWIHKWRLRLCFNAQKEIFDASLDELRQVQRVHPELTRWLGPPCSFVAAAQPPELQDDVAACCPEGPRWCGVKVWKNFDAQTGKPKRPF